MHWSSSRRLTLLFALLLIGGPAFAAGPTNARPGLQAPQTAGVADDPDGTMQHRTLDETERKKARFHMDFDKVDITEVIKYIAQWTGRNFILGDNIRGKITIIGPTDVSADEAYNAFIASLDVNNLQVTPVGRFLKVLPKKDTTRTNLPTCITPPCNFPTNEEMVTRMFRLKYNEVEPMKNVLQGFISREGEMVTFAPDILIVSDDAMNIARVDRLLKELDQPGAQEDLNVVQVLHATAQELAATLTQIFPAQGAAGAAGAAAGRHTIINMPAPTPVPGAPPATPGADATPGPVTVTKIIPDERSNKLIVIANAKAFARIRELILKLDVATNAGQVHVYYLENADAEEMAATLSSVANGTKKTGKGTSPGQAAPPPPATNGAPGAAGSGAIFSGDVKVTADKATNSVLIVASPNDYRNVLKVIDKLDIRRRQVFIEAVIMEVNLTDDDTLSFDFHGGSAVQNVNIPGGGGSGVAPYIIGSEQSGAGASLSLANVASMTGFLAGIQGPPITVNGLNITLPAFGVIMNALQTNSDVNVISTPHILTTDNAEAEISVGETVPFQTAVPLGGLGGLAGLAGLGAAGSTATTGLGLGGLGLGGLAPIQRQPVELRLKIKPHINQSDFVKLEIDEQVEEIASVDPVRGPTTSKRAVKTTIVAKDQTSVVIGGLIQERTTHSESRTPILGEIPIIGALFRSDEVKRQKTNLLLFLTPYIIRDQADFRAIFEKKMRERQEFVTRFFGDQDQYQASVDYSHKHGPTSVLMSSVKNEYDRVENGGPGTADEKVFLAVPPPGSLPPASMPPGSTPSAVPPPGATSPAPPVAAPAAGTPAPGSTPPSATPPPPVTNGAPAPGVPPTGTYLPGTPAVTGPFVAPKNPPPLELPQPEEGTGPDTLGTTPDTGTAAPDVPPIPGPEAAPAPAPEAAPPADARPPVHQ